MLYQLSYFPIRENANSISHLSAVAQGGILQSFTFASYRLIPLWFMNSQMRPSQV